MTTRLIEFFSKIYRRPKIIVIAGITVTAIFAAAIPFINLDNDIKNFLSVNHPHRVSNDRLDGIFGSSEVIFIGIESDNAFSRESIEYVRWLQGEIEKLNWEFPARIISKEMKISNDEAKQVIDAINRTEVYGRDAVKELFSSPEKMSEQLFWDIGFSKKISGRVSGISIDRLMKMYRFPASSIDSVLNTDFIRGEGDKFVVEKLIDQNRIDDESIKSMRGKVKSWNIYDKTLFSSDDRMTTVAIRLNPIDINHRQMFNLEVEKLIRQNQRNDLKIYLAGEPVFSDRVSGSMGDDLKGLLPFVILVMIVVLIIIFRHHEGVLFPMVAMMCSVIWTVGTMAIFKVPMSMISITIPIVLTAVASAYGIHFMTHYFMSGESSRYESSVDSMRVSGLGIVMAALTTVAGFGSLATSDMTHIRNYGIITALGVFYSLVISVTLMPALLLLKKGSKPKLQFVEKEGDSSDISSRFLNSIRSHAGRYPVAVLLASALIVGVSAFGMRSLKVNMDSMDFFQQGSELKRSDQRLNELLSGTQLLDINIESRDGAEVITPEILSKVESFQRDILSRYEIAGKAVSVADLLKKMNQEMHGGDSSYYRLPESQQMTREYLLLYSGDIDDMITKNRDKIRIQLSMKRAPIAKMSEIRNYSMKYFDKEFIEKNNITVQSSGYIDLMIETNMLVVYGQISSLLSSLLIVTILMFMIFRSIRYTLISLIPLAVGISMNFGLMGFANIPLNAATALVASISIGMGIDYSIHFINQFKNSMKETPDIDLAIQKTYQGTGRAILSNVASVMAGFLVLLFSKFPIIAQCGGLVAFTITVTGFAAIIIIPAAMKVLIAAEKRKSL